MLAQLHTGTFDKSSIAHLTAALLVEMQADQLISVIQAADLPGRCHSEFDRHPEQYDRQILLRLAHIARHSCRVRGY